MDVFIKYRTLKTIGITLLLVPVLLFFLFWLNVSIGIVLSLMLLVAVYFALKDDYSMKVNSENFCKSNNETEKTKDGLCLSLWVLVGVIVLMFVWSFVSGQGGFVPQKFDHAYRNAILRDMITYSWPVTYPDMHNGALVYYIAYWMLPALIGKLGVLVGGDGLGWTLANVTGLLYSTAVLSTVFLLILQYLKKSSFKEAAIIAVIFILFSGMDVLEALSLSFIKPINWEHLEWSLGAFQYSSNSTQLCWVFNQTTPAWLAIMLFLTDRKIANYGLIGMLLLPFAPLIVIGLFFFAAADMLREFCRKPLMENGIKALKEILSPANMLAIVSVLPVFYLYYTSNATYSASIGATEVRGNLFSSPFVLFMMTYGILCEGLVLALLIFSCCKNNILYWVALVSLAVIPWIRFVSEDFQMRTSVVALFVLMLLTIRALFEKEVRNARKATIILLLGIGAITPAVEYIALLNKDVGNSDYVITLSSPYHGDYFSNFVTRDKDDKFFFKYLAN